MHASCADRWAIRRGGLVPMLHSLEYDWPNIFAQPCAAKQKPWVPINCSEREVERAYKKAAFQLHPDRLLTSTPDPAVREEAQELLKLLTTAKADRDNWHKQGTDKCFPSTAPASREGKRSTAKADRDNSHKQGTDKCFPSSKSSTAPASREGKRSAVEDVQDFETRAATWDHIFDRWLHHDEAEKDPFERRPQSADEDPFDRQPQSADKDPFDRRPKCAEEDPFDRPPVSVTRPSRPPPVRGSPQTPSHGTPSPLGGVLHSLDTLLRSVHAAEASGLDPQQREQMQAAVECTVRRLNITNSAGEAESEATALRQDLAAAKVAYAEMSARCEELSHELWRLRKEQATSASL
mmetsp:Transcript_61368/g.102140  ORF Transcript_61368/g.102140 Transcript_61368/m.102140 type:complete len:351 (+) Transcript_61368:38-1090(+)